MVLGYPLSLPFRGCVQAVGIWSDLGPARGPEALGLIGHTLLGFGSGVVRGAGVHLGIGETVIQYLWFPEHISGRLYTRSQKPFEIMNDWALLQGKHALSR